jgi:hypothetical protein
MQRQNNFHADCEASYGSADLSHFGDNLMASRNGTGQRRIATLHDGAIKITNANSDRTHNGGVIARQLRRRDLKPFESIRRHQSELLHWPKSL